MAPTAAFAVAYLFAAFLVSVHADRPSGRSTSLLQKKTLRLRAVSLADVSVSSDTKRSLKIKASQKTSSKDPLSSGWFGDFSQDESTYTTEGLDASSNDPERAVKYGRDPSLESPYQNSQVFNSAFFHESQSGGPSAAWQTNYPSVPSGVAGNHHKENPWKQTPIGWVQEYRGMPDSGSGGPSSADWFDNSVREVDGFSRPMQPGLLDGARYVSSDGWQERSVNTTLVCKDPGCTARASLQLFDASKEDARLCSLSVAIHPTDYDDDWSSEHVEYLKVNGYVANRECNPRARGCNATAERPLYSCLNGFNVDKIIDSQGTLVLEGKNTIKVDECPHQGNLLSGVAMATCMVRSKSYNLLSAPTTTTTMWAMSDLFGESELKCATPGCTAESLIYFSPAIALNGGTCTMNVTVHQTDFDDHLGLPEQIDFIQVEGTNVTTAPIQPGKNPCNSQYKNITLSASDRIFTAVKSFDITALVKKSHPLGALRVRGKISDQVDECGHEGNLLSGNVTVRCVPPANFAAPPPAKQTALLHAPKHAAAAPKPAALLQAAARRA